MTVIQHIRRRIDIGELLPGEGQLAVGIQATFSDSGLPRTSPIVFFCVPGGGLSSGYYDLRIDTDTRFSFAASVAARGMMTIAMDPLGTGESSRPRDGFRLTPDVIACANARARERVIEELASGTFAPSLPRIPNLFSIGTGHSIGGLFIVLEQAQRRRFDAVALLGFGTGGLPAVLDAELRSFAGQPESVRENVVRLARARHPEPYFELPSDGRAREVYGGHAEPRALDALREARTSLLATPSVFVIIPGSSAPAAAQIDVPLFLAVGSQDMCGSPHELPASFPGSSDITLIRLADTGHTHFVFASAPRLFARLADWAAGLTTSLC